MRENSVWLHGQVYGQPKVFLNKEKEPVKARFTMRVIRRAKTLNGMPNDDIRLDYIVISTSDLAHIEYCRQNIREGDMVDVCGVYTTHNVTKIFQCPHCETNNVMPGVLSYITPLYLCAREQSLSELDGVALLKERNEISNNIFVIGTLMSDVAYYEDDSQKYSQYCIEIGRKFWIKTDPADLKKDYPYVKSYGILGKRDKEYLKKYDHVHIRGSLATRSFDRKRICEHCGEEFTFRDSTMEIHSYSVDYLDEKIRDFSDDDENTFLEDLEEENINE